MSAATRHDLIATAAFDGTIRLWRTPVGGAAQKLARRAGAAAGLLACRLPLKEATDLPRGLLC